MKWLFLWLVLADSWLQVQCSTLGEVGMPLRCCANRHVGCLYYANVSLSSSGDYCCKKCEGISPDKWSMCRAHGKYCKRNNVEAEDLPDPDPAPAQKRVSPMFAKAYKKLLQKKSDKVKTATSAATSVKSSYKALQETKRIQHIARLNRTRYAVPKSEAKRSSVASKAEAHSDHEDIQDAESDECKIQEEEAEQDEDEDMEEELQEDEEVLQEDDGEEELQEDDPEEAQEAWWTGGDESWWTEAWWTERPWREKSEAFATKGPVEVPLYHKTMTIAIDHNTNEKIPLWTEWYRIDPELDDVTAFRNETEWSLDRVEYQEELHPELVKKEEEAEQDKDDSEDH